jgi:hypothetical protein
MRFAEKLASRFLKNRGFLAGTIYTQSTQTTQSSRVHAAAGAISRAMRFALAISATRKSYAACKFSHERASPPK